MGWFTKKKPKRSDVPHPSHTLPDFVRGIQHAVNSASTMAEKNSAAFLDRHFRNDGSPEVEIVKIPGTKMCLVVPTVTVANPPRMVLEEMEVRMAVRFDQTESKPAHPDDTEVTRTSFQVALSGEAQDERHSNVVDLVMKFKRGDPPEGVARVIAEFVNTIKPIDVDQALKEHPEIKGPTGDRAADTASDQPAGEGEEPKP